VVGGRRRRGCLLARSMGLRGRRVVVAAGRVAGRGGS